jgi:hypothetical protein
VAAGLSTLSVSESAHAHGGVVRAFEILNHPANPETFVLRSDVWGFFHSHDAGKSWQWSCSEVYGTKSTEVNHTQMTLTKSGRLIVANAFDGMHYTDDFCSWNQSTGLDDLLVADVRIHGNDVMALTSTGGEGGISNIIWLSKDQGKSFEPFNADLPKDIVLTSLGIAPSDPQRVYALGLVIGAPEGVILRSKDGGQTFERFAAPAVDTARLAVRIQAMHPTNPDVVFEWIDLPEDVNQDSHDQIKVTTDGGKTWTPVFSGKGDLPGLAISPDAQTVVISGAVDGVHTGSLDAVLAGAEGALTLVNPRPVWGLLWNENGLYGGNNNFSQKDTPETYTLGISRNEGETFDEIVNICDFKFSHCQAGQQGYDLCRYNWDDASEAGGFKKDFWLNSGRCNVDGGLVGSGGSSSSGGTSGSGGNTGASGGSAPASGGSTPASGGSTPASTGGSKNQGSVRKGGCAMSAPGSAAQSGSLLALALGALGLRSLRRRR